MKQGFFKENWIHLVAVAAFMLIALINFYPRLQDKQLVAGDAISVKAMQQEINEFKEETGESSLWTNAMFGGMPTYYIGFHKPKDLIDYTWKFLQAGMPREIGFFFLGMVCFYILMITMGVAPLISIFAAIGFAFSTNNIILLSAGHFTKIAAVMASPLVVAGVVQAYRYKYLQGLALFALGMALNLKGDHPQMTYYLALILLPLVLVRLYKSFKEKRLPDFAKASGILLIGLLLAVGTSMSKLWPVYEYSQDTMRGKPILENNQDDFSSSSVEGLSWDYAMSWSNGWVDLLQSFIPHSVGGSSMEEMSSDTEFAKELRKRGVSTRKGVQGPMYWGALPFTSGPIYFGVVIFALFFIAMFVLKGPLKWWVLAGVLLTALLSLGKNFEFLSRLFYEYLPVYNKFRTPNSILSITTILIPFLGFLGLGKIIKEDMDIKKVLYPGLGLAAFCALVAFIGPSMADMTSAYDARYEQMGIDPDILKADRAALMQSSALRSCVFILITLGLLYGFLKQKIKSSTMVLGIGFLAIVDLFGVNFKYVKPSDFVSQRSYENNFQMRDVDKQILADPDQHYRVFDLTISTFESASSSYYHKTIGGYHPAKLQRYQDLIDQHISRNNMNVINMLNTKYIIMQGNDGKEAVQRNTAALGNAWFVSNIQQVNSADAEIAALQDFDPLSTAVVHDEFSDYVQGLGGSKNGRISLTSYQPNELIYESSSTTDQLAVFSEIWYGPDKGWQAYIDDTPVDHIRVNYVLRGLKVPAGEHTIRFVFDPASAKTGFLISFICSVLILALLGFYLFRRMRTKTND